MIFTHCDDNFTVVDDVLSPNAFSDLWRSVQALKYDFPGSEWMRLWPLSDPQPVMSGPFRWSERPCGHGMDLYIDAFKNCVDDRRGCLSGASAWVDIAFRVFLHGRGSRMVAHSDAPKYVGAGVFYAHPKWDANWGGEICFPSMSGGVDCANMSVSGESLTNSVLNEAVQAKAFGTYVSPRPNRLVLIRGGTIHSINRIDSDAGAAVRCSITSFLMPGDESWNESARRTFSLD